MTLRAEIKKYSNHHRHPVNKLLHWLSIPMIIIGIVLLLTSSLTRGIIYIVLGAILLKLGHIIEGNRPLLKRDRRALYWALLWWFQTSVDFVQNLFKSNHTTRS